MSLLRHSKKTFFLTTAFVMNGSQRRAPGKCMRLLQSVRKDTSLELCGFPEDLQHGNVARKEISFRRSVFARRLAGCNNNK
jgi:hypothetical protein